MAVLSPATSKLKAQLKMAVNRLRLVQEKDTALAKQQRRNLAQLLEIGKEQTAKIKVENIIRQDEEVELLEILELYCELLLARVGLLENREVDPGLEEAVKTIVYTAPHTEIKELHQIRELFLRKYSREWAKEAMENTTNSVPERVLKKLSTDPPSQDLVTQYLIEIARAYQVPFSGLPPEDTDGGHPELPIEQTESKEKEAIAEPVAAGGPPSAPGPPAARPRPAAPKEDDELAALKDRFEALRKR